MSEQLIYSATLVNINVDKENRSIKIVNTRRLNKLFTVSFILKGRKKSSSGQYYSSDFLKCAKAGSKGTIDGLLCQ